VLALLILVFTAYALRQWNRNNRTINALELGNKAYEKENWEEAVNNLGRYISVVPDNVSILLKYASAQLNIRPLKSVNIQQAIGTYRQVLRLDKSNSEAVENLVEIYLEMNTPAEAEFIARESLKINETSRLRRMLAVALVQQRKFQEALDELTQVIDKYPEDILAYETLGQIAEHSPMDISFDPEPWFNKAVENNPESSHAYIARASYHLRHNDKDSALADLAIAEKLDLSDTYVKMRLINEYVNLKNYEKAEFYLSELQAENPDDPALWKIWAQLALRSGSKSKMLWVAREGLNALTTKNWDFMPTAIDLFIQADEYDQAALYIEKLRQLEIIPATLAYYDGVIAYYKNKNNQAISHWREAIALGNTSAKLRIILAEALEKTGNILEALQQLRTLVTDQPDSFQAHWKYAELLARTGIWSEAAKEALLAQEINPGSLEAALLNIKIKMQILQQGGIKQGDPEWKVIENKLAQLEETVGGNLDLKLIEFQLALNLQQYEKAENLMADMLNTDPSNIMVALAELDLLYRQGKSDQIEAKLRKIVQDHPQSVIPVKSLALLLSRQDKMIECEKVINDALVRMQHSQDQRDLQILLADLYRSQNKTDKAYLVLKTLSSQLPQDIYVKRRLLTYEQTFENDSKAQELVDKIRELEGPDGWQWRYEQAKLWLAGKNFQNNYAQIISLLKDNLRAYPDDNPSRLLLATAYEQAGDLQLALSSYRQAYHRSPQDLTVIIPTVAALNKAGEFKEANEILNHVAQHYVYHPIISSLQYQSYIGLGEVDSGIDLLEDLLKADPDNRQIQLQIAILKMRQDKFNEAEILLNELRKDDPDFLPVLVALIELHVKQGQPETAIQLCNTIVEKQKDSSAFLIRAQTYAMLGMPDKAENDFTHAAVIDPDNIDVLVETAQFYLSQGKPDQALSTVQTALSLDPINLKAQKIAIPLLSNSNDSDKLDRAKTILAEALQANPDDVELRLYKAQILLVSGTKTDIKQAIDILQNVTRDNPESSQAWRLLGELALQQKQGGKAMDLVLRGLSSSPNNKDLLLLKARCEEYRSPLLAIPTLKTLKQLYPNDTDITLYLAYTYTSSGDAKKAITILQEELVSTEGDDRRKIKTALAAAMYVDGDKDEALKQLEFLFNSATDDPRPLLTQAELLRNDQRWSELREKADQWYDIYAKGAELLITLSDRLAASDEAEARKTAEQILRYVLNKDPENTDAMLTLATLLQLMNRVDESAEYYYNILERMPDNLIAINNLAWILCEHLNKYQQALELARRGLNQKPDYIDLIDTRGVVYYRLGEHEKAIRDFNKCIELFPTLAPGIAGSYFHLGRAQAQIGQKYKALKNLKQGLEINNNTGGLSEADLNEAQRLYDELSLEL
ncbi:MAG: tetratricopeptide repeat protein, partial [Sedimentisphaerales bacterium]|nr:tetratricopeptide repeat protein [Sedimentisphaerales bacterium]